MAARGHKNSVAFIGYAGHAYVCIDTAVSCGMEPVGYYDLSEVAVNPYGLTYLGISDELVPGMGQIFLSIGDNGLRERRYRKTIERFDESFATLIHARACVSSSATLGAATLVSAGAVINALSEIGIGCIVNSGAIVEHECILGNFSHIAPGAVLTGNVKVGDRSFVGANAVVRPGITIGKDVIIGAGAVIVKDVPDGSTIVGNPGKLI